MPRYTVDEEIEMLAAGGLLTERQAEVYVRRRVEAEPGYAVAEDLDVSQATVSGLVADAEDKLAAARETLDALEEIRNQIPEECVECGDTLGGRFVTEDGNALCLECTDADLSEFWGDA